MTVTKGRQPLARPAVVSRPLMTTPVVTRVMNTARPVRQAWALLRRCLLNGAVDSVALSLEDVRYLLPETHMPTDITEKRYQECNISLFLTVNRRRIGELVGQVGAFSSSWNRLISAAATGASPRSAPGRVPSVGRAPQRDPVVVAAVHAAMSGRAAWPKLPL
jgi:hypothetical protein